MPRDGDKCDRAGTYRLTGLIERRGRDGKVIDWLDELTADCPRKRSGNTNDPWGEVPGPAENPLMRETNGVGRVTRNQGLIQLVKSLSQ